MARRGRRNWRRRWWWRGGRPLGAGRGCGRGREVGGVGRPVVGSRRKGHGYCGAHDRCAAPGGGVVLLKNGPMGLRGTCRDKRGLQGLQAAAHRACGRAKVQTANQTCRVQTDEARLRRRERGRCVGPAEAESSGSVFLWPLRLCNASGRTRLFSGRQNPKKERRGKTTAVCLPLRG